MQARYLGLVLGGALAGLLPQVANAELWGLTDSFTLPVDDPAAQTVGGNCTAALAGCTGSLTTISHAVAGTVTVVDDCTLKISGWEFDGQGPAVEWWVDQPGADPTKWADSDAAYKVAEVGDPEAQAYTPGASHGGAGDVIVKFGTDEAGEPLTLTDEFIHLSVWCEEFAIDFGNTVLECPAA